MNYKEELIYILQESYSLIRNQEFPILEFKEEKKADAYNLDFAEETLVSKINSTIEKPVSLGKNQDCKLCPNRLFATKSFIHIGKIPTLVLHFSGETKKTHPTFSKTKANLIFRNDSYEDLFDRLCMKALNINMRHLFYQEFPACTFSPQNSSDEDWKLRIENCEIHILDTIQKYNIQSIILIGVAAVLFYGKEEATEQTGKITNIQFSDKILPSLVLRSPEGILNLEEKRKKINREQNRIEFEKAKLEEDTVKRTTLEHLQNFKEYILN